MLIWTFHTNFNLNRDLYTKPRTNALESKKCVQNVLQITKISKKKKKIQFTLDGSKSFRFFAAYFN